MTAYKARERARLPAGDHGRLVRLLDRRALAAAGRIDAPAPYDAIPLHVRAGSIVPFGPELQYTDEKPADPITLFVYAGATAPSLFTRTTA